MHVFTHRHAADRQSAPRAELQLHPRAVDRHARRARRRARRDRGGESIGATTTTTPLAALRAHRSGCAAPRSSSQPSTASRSEAMSRDGVVGVRLPFIGLPKLPDITTFDYRALVPPPRRSRLARPSSCRRRATCRRSCRRWKPPASRSWSIISAGPIRDTGINSDGFKALLRSIDKGRTWVKVSGGYRLGPQASDYARELLRVAGARSPGVGERLPLRRARGASFLSGHDRLAGRRIPRRDRAREIFGETARELYFNGE